MTEEHRWTDRLSDYLNGDVSPRERVELDEHLAECEACRNVLDGLREVVARARALPAPAPERDLWPGIAEAIAEAGEREAEDGVIALPTPRAGGARTLRRGVLLSPPQLAAAAVTLAFASSLATWWVSSGRSAQAPDLGAPSAVTAIRSQEAPAGLGPELQDLEEALARTSAQLDPETRRVIEKNLAVIERAIEDSRRALLVDPGNAFLEEHLERAYRRKLTYLRDAAQLATWSG